MAYDCPSSRLRASWTPAQRAAFDAEDRASEALELEFPIAPRPTPKTTRRTHKARQEAIYGKAQDPIALEEA